MSGMLRTARTAQTRSHGLGISETAEQFFAPPGHLIADGCEFDVPAARVHRLMLELLQRRHVHRQGLPGLVADGFFASRHVEHPRAGF